MRTKSGARLEVDKTPLPWKSQVCIPSDLPITNRLRLIEVRSVQDIFEAFLPYTPYFRRSFRRYVRLMRKDGKVPSARVESTIKEMVYHYLFNLKKHKESAEMREGRKDFYGLRSVDIREHVGQKKFYRWIDELVQEGLVQKAYYDEMLQYFRKKKGRKGRIPKRVRKPLVRYTLDLSLILSTLFQARRCEIEGDLGVLTKAVNVHEPDELVWDRLSPKALLDSFTLMELRGMFTNEQLEILFSPEDSQRIMRKR